MRFQRSVLLIAGGGSQLRFTLNVVGIIVHHDHVSGEESSVMYIMMPNSFAPQPSALTPPELESRWPICARCGKTYSSKRALSFHLRTVHSDVYYSCEYCDHKFNRASSLKRHVATKHALLRL